jgi:parallel beta-helix repeat protein
MKTRSPRWKESQVRSSSSFRPRSAIAATLLIVGVFLGLNASSALAAHVTCGKYITQDTTLDSDVLGCEGNGIVIGADNITLDLNGHTISGNNFNYGVLNYRHTGVEIRGPGTIRFFYYGVGLDDATRNVVSNVTGEFNSASAISVYESSENFVANNTSTSSTSGIVVTEGHRNVIWNNSIAGGIGAGIYLLEFASENFVARNSVRGLFFGALLFDADNNHFSRNKFIENGTGVRLIGEEGADGNAFDRNEATLNGGDGFYIPVNSSGTVLRRNVANQNGADGIDVDDRATTLTRNTANNNDDLGIEAVPGVTDGGGNTASGNGNPAQCSASISCSQP